MVRRSARRVRYVLATLMLLTGLLGQVGHDWAHGAGESQRAWSQAMQAEQAWLAGSGLADDDAEPSVQIFAAGKGHSHGDGTDPLHDGLASDHAHSVVFLMPPGSAPRMAGMLDDRPWPAQIRVPLTPSNSLERPPRTA